jgi:hypothetical protein
MQPSSVQVISNSAQNAPRLQIRSNRPAHLATDLAPDRLQHRLANALSLPIAGMVRLGGPSAINAH